VSKSLNIGLVGATGIVGNTVVEVLDEYDFSNHTFRAFASNHASNRTVTIHGTGIAVEPIPVSVPELDYALFTAPGSVAGELIPPWTKKGIKIVDNSSVFRLDKEVPLVVPEVNPGEIRNAENLIANPNCSTIQLAVALKPLDDRFGIETVSVATYQAVSGAGRSALNRWNEEVMGAPVGQSPFPRPIHGNLIPVIGPIVEGGYCNEEQKMMQELPKILGRDKMEVAVTTVRVPVGVGHSEVVDVTLSKSSSVDELLDTLENGQGLVVVRDSQDFPTPLEIAGQNDTFVGRVRMVPGNDSRFLLWIVADNLRKGAATNAIQILEEWIKHDEN
jgi:aspartate-semialdehyde dehydrogenase